MLSIAISILYLTASGDMIRQEKISAPMSLEECRTSFIPTMEQWAESNGIRVKVSCDPLNPQQRIASRK